MAIMNDRRSLNFCVGTVTYVGIVMCIGTVMKVGISQIFSDASQTDSGVDRIPLRVP